MKTLTNTTELTMVEIVTLLGADNLNQSPSTKNAPLRSRVAPVAFHDNHPFMVLDLEQQGGDVYDLLENVTPEPSVNFYAVITAGWASPLNEDDNDIVPPSQHPKRRRVELMCLVSRDGKIASALSMSGNDELITDEGKAVGSLNDAVRAIFG